MLARGQLGERGWAQAVELLTRLLRVKKRERVGETAWLQRRGQELAGGESECWRATGELRTVDESPEERLGADGGRATPAAE